MGKEGFKELRVWQKGKDLAVFLYGITHTGLFSKDQALRDQMRRAALSIPSNIAEGDQLDTDKQAVRHFYFAKGSAAELLSHAIIALEIGYIDQKTFKVVETRCLEISGMLSKLIKIRSGS
ncbi:MAG TPA: four helix bundle protein [Syntrophales bacterium]|nr:four helix bundle protein [Syntrophales bacterium]HOX93974.1 four helix bundle protein [Syntrophales bacterium]HPI57415.1 four helix bundle protein [Syntrophales bacterium]HPN25479.1 four helix bundle protein [Syntrophales bacterium]HQM29961.1 four helix bundle protein [Syntrophales bacterium]